MPEFDLADVQIKTLNAAKQVLEKIPGVKVAQYHLAWTRGMNSFLVTDYYEGEPVYLGFNPKEHYFSINGKYIDKRVKRLKKASKGKFHDVEYANLMYLPKEDIVLVFDLRPVVE